MKGRQNLLTVSMLLVLSDENAAEGAWTPTYSDNVVVVVLVHHRRGGRVVDAH